MRRLFLYQLFTMLAFLMLLVSCSQNISSPSEIKSSYSGTEIDAMMPSLVASSDGALEMTVDVLNLEVSKEASLELYYTLSLKIEFQNISERAIVFKKPRSTGFAGQGIGAQTLVFNDVGVVIQREDGVPMGVVPTTEFAPISPAKTIVEAFYYHTPDDFIELEAEEVYSYVYGYKLPQVIFDENAKTLQETPPGVYNLFVGYGNDYIGYQTARSLSLTSPSYSTNPDTELIDLGAWVGKIVSNSVVFTVPDTLN